MAGRRPILHDQLDQVRRLRHLGAATPLERRTTVIFDLEHVDDGVALVFEGRELRFPEKAASAVEAVAGRPGTFTAADLPGPLDSEGRLVLARRLVREGFLRVVT